MSGLVGIISHERDAPVVEAELEELTSAYESLRGGVGGRDSAVAGDFARIRKLTPEANGAPPSASPDSWVLCSGTPHDPEASGGRDVERLDGQFVWVSYDATRDELSLASDPFGMQAVYVAQRDRKTYMATSALALAKYLRARPSRLGVSVFLRAGYQFGSVTLWEGIERLDPGTRLIFSARGPQREIYWRPSVDEGVTALSLADTVDYCRSVATETYRSYYSRGRPRSWADLTGGYDSRLLTLLLSHAGVDFITNTGGREQSADALIAPRVANAAGWDWRRFDIPSSWSEVLPGLIPQALAWGDCHLEVVQLAEVLWGHIEKARVHRTLLSGGGGEHLRNFAWQQEFLRGGRTNIVNLDNWVNMRMLKPVDTQAFARDPTPLVRDDLRTRMTAAAEPYSSHLNTVQLDIMYAYKCTGHFGAYLSAASGILNVELPFYLKPVFNAVFSTSHRHRNAHRLMRHMIDTLDAPLAAITTTDGGPAQPPRLTNMHRYVPYFAQISRKALTKLSEVAISRPLLLPTAPADSTRAAAREALVQGLDDGRPLRAEAMRCGSLFKRDALNDLLLSAREPSFGHAALFGRILTVELALRAVDAALDE